MENVLLYVLTGLTAVLLVLVVVLLLKRQKPAEVDDRRLVQQLQSELDRLRNEIQTGLRDNRMESTKTLNESMQALSRVLSDGQDNTRRAVSDMARRNDEQLEALRKTIGDSLTAMRTENTAQLESMRQTVDERLQKTLEDRISQSFRQVSEQLEQVYKGLGEMQTLASGVGDLKRVLSNVKTRGILGEIQLGAILEQMLSPEQYAANVVTKKNSRDPVEFAVRMPGADEGTVWLPIDAKFPADAYIRLEDAYAAGDADGIAAAGKELAQFIKQSARTIRDKYVDPPHTTDFAIMFLPTEGLYAEVLRLGLLEPLQRDYRVNIAGPTTMAALLNSLQMGFRTLAIQKRSGEVWHLLGAVKTEFDNFGKVVDSVRKRLQQADTDLDTLVGVRTRAIQRRLRDVEALPETAAAAVLDVAAPEEE